MKKFVLAFRATWSMFAAPTWPSIPVRSVVLAAAGLFVVASGPATASDLTAQLAGEKVAVVVYAHDETAESFRRSALSRLEGIFADNDIIVLDQDKADELKDVFNTLDDPGAFVTAEMFIENAGKFDIAGLAAIHLTADVAPGLSDYFTATAHADVRFISEADAHVTSLTTTPMGAPGRPPSDGLTERAALINAVQRAVDDAADKMGLEIMEPANPRSVRLALEGPVPPPAGDLPSRKPSVDGDLVALASFEASKWRKVDATCTAKAPGGSMGAVAVYIKDTDMHRRPPRLYGSEIHLVDTELRQGIATYECHPVAKKTRREKGKKEVLDCVFLQNWRFLAAVTGNTLFLWDTERGVLISEVALESSPKSAALHFVRVAEGAFLVVDAGRKPAAYRLARQK